MILEGPKSPLWWEDMLAVSMVAKAGSWEPTSSAVGTEHRDGTRSGARLSALKATLPCDVLSGHVYP